MWQVRSLAVIASTWGSFSADLLAHGIGLADITLVWVTWWGAKLSALVLPSWRGWSVVVLVWPWGSVSVILLFAISAGTLGTLFTNIQTGVVLIGIRMGFSALEASTRGFAVALGETLAIP